MDDPPLTAAATTGSLLRHGARPATWPAGNRTTTAARAAALPTTTAVVATGLVAEAVAALLREHGIRAHVTSHPQSRTALVWVLVADGHDLGAEVRRIRAVRPGARVLVLVGEADAAVLRDAQALCVEGVVDGRAGGHDLAAAVRSVAMGRRVVPATMVLDASADEGVLSARQRDVLRLLAEGRSNVEIAQALTISVNTVKFHVRTIFRELGIHNRVEAARVWAEHEGRTHLMG